MRVTQSSLPYGEILSQANKNIPIFRISIMNPVFSGNTMVVNFWSQMFFVHLKRTKTDMDMLLVVSCGKIHKEFRKKKMSEIFENTGFSIVFPSFEKTFEKPKKIVENC